MTGDLSFFSAKLASSLRKRDAVRSKVNPTHAPLAAVAAEKPPLPSSYQSLSSIQVSVSYKIPHLNPTFNPHTLPRPILLKIEPHPLPPRRHLRHASRRKSALARDGFVDRAQLLAQLALVVGVFELRVCVGDGRAGWEPEVLGLVGGGGVLVDVEVLRVAEEGYALGFEGRGLVVGVG